MGSMWGLKTANITINSLLPCASITQGSIMSLATERGEIFREVRCFEQITDTPPLRRPSRTVCYTV